MQTPTLTPSTSLGSPSVTSNLLQRLARGEGRAALTFAGQGLGVLDELAGLWRSHPNVRPILQAAELRFQRWMDERELRWSGAYTRGVPLCRWLTDEASRPDAAYTQSTALSNPLIFLAQMCRYLALYEEGLGQLFEARALTGVTGHSQGIMPALLVAESPGGKVKTDRLLQYLDYMIWQGLTMTLSYRGTPRDGANTCMAAVSGPDRADLQVALDRLNAALPEAERLYLTLENTRTRNVVSGAPASLGRLKAALEARVGADAAARKEGRLGGRPFTFSWEALDVGGPFHSAYMAPGLAHMREAVANLGFKVESRDLHLPVFSPVDGARWDQGVDVTEALLVAQYLQPVRWPVAVRAVSQGADWVLDLGPGDGVARLSRGNLRGSGLRVLSLSSGTATPSPELRTLLSAGAPEPARPILWSSLRPRMGLGADRSPRIENRFVAATGLPPVLLPGMTPTTVDAPIVAAAANAGFWAEWAGGGQVSERLFWTRLDQLSAMLNPGREVVFNALFLDPYLWGLHLGKAQLVQRARRLGYPIGGVIVSAGVPELDEARRLLDELASLDMRWSGFKPGTVAQIEAVAKIAEASPEHRIFVQIEGGKAGGHHSWEDLEALLLDTYGRLRDLPNVILCAGGGIATEARANELLTGAWSERRGLLPMPVDAVFLGTLAMACKEATASDAVKAALVAAGGTDRWVHAGAVSGGVTSGKSQLGADIHYLDNAAAQVGRLLDQVAGDANAVAARRDEIISALDRTAKPYFGDVESMSWSQLLRRAAALMAIGQGRPEDDGPWPDPSYRARFADLARRAEARLASRPTDSLVDVGLKALDQPLDLIVQIETKYPESTRRRVSAPDARWFVRSVCSRPGKPVNFVPVIDADVRRWYKADSLWQAQDPRYSADQVLIIPGPEAVRGITATDEPVAELLGRFERALAQTLPAPSPKTSARDARLPPEILVESGLNGQVLRVVRPPTSPSAWLDALSRLHRGPLAAFLGEARINAGSRRVPNPARRVLRAEPGATLSLDLGSDGALTALTYRPAAGGEPARLSWRLPQIRLDLPVAGISGKALLSLSITARPSGAGYAFHQDPAVERDALRRLYLESLLGSTAPPAALFEVAEDEVLLDPATVPAYAALTGAPAAEVPINLAFSMVLRPLFRVLANEALAGGLLRLVHLDNQIQTGPAWPPAPGARLRTRAVLERIEDAESGRTLTLRAQVLGEEAVVAEVQSRFFLRAGGSERYDRSEHRVRAREQVQARLDLREAGDVDFLASHAWIQPTEPLSLGAYELRASVAEDRPRVGLAVFGASGALLRDGRPVATLNLAVEADLAAHPLRALLEALGADRQTQRATPRRELAGALDVAPPDLRGFSEVSGDHNPIHASIPVARLAGLDGPIVHGQWTAARLAGHMASTGLLSSFEARFVAPLLPGERVRLDVARVGLDRGGELLEGAVYALRGETAVPVLQSKARRSPARTAALFPGQGVQRPGMGMAAMARSPAAAAVWQEADQITRNDLGFSLLEVVRENPKTLTADGQRFVHPDGVLHSTAFTQVALAALANAQIAELREAGALAGPEDPTLISAGHSLGEYNAIGALFGVIPLRTVIRVVWARGLTMHTLVPRDETGESGYRMGVIRPNLAGLDHAGAEALVERVRSESGHFLQIVNYNVRGRQYSVTGQRPAIDALKAALAARTRDASKPAWVEVPGIDVPFHSDVLRDGAPAFRAVLEQVLGEDLAVERLVGRYVPNLVAQVFRLDREFVEVVARATGSAALNEALAGELIPDRKLGRLLLIELLAWQFCSPVRWIETTELLTRPAALGGVGVARLLEVGPGESPTLANMARAALSGMGPAAPTVLVLNAEADRAAVYALDEDAAPAAAPAKAAPAPRPVAATPAPSAAPAPSAGPVATVPDQPLSVGEAVRALLAMSGRVRPEQLRDTETLDELFDGVSSRRNQVLLDLGAELGAGGLDGAAEKALGALVGELDRKATRYKGPGKVLAEAGDEALKRLFGRHQLGRREIAAHLDQAWGLGGGWAEAVILHVALEAREGPSGRGGALGRWASPPESREACKGLVDEAVAAVAKGRGVAVGRRDAAASGGAAADPAALLALEQRILGPGGALGKVATALSEGLGLKLERPGWTAPTARVEAEDRYNAIVAEHGAAYVELIQPLFDARKHVAFSSAWAWARRDLARLVFRAANGDAAALDAEIDRLSAFAQDRTFAETAAWYRGVAAARGDETLAAALGRLDGAARPLPISPTRPHLEIGQNGALNYSERPDPAGLGGFIETARDLVGSDRAQVAWQDAITALGRAPLPVAGKVALVTGASPGSIALELVRQLLWGGATVIVTTSGLDEGRARMYRRLYQSNAGPGAVLHVLPLNQGSLNDTTALLDWLAGRGLVPDLLVPFAALKEAGSLGEDPARAAAALRVQLLGVEALIAGTARRRKGGPPCQVLLPLSPNHGAFGGDGAYAETKAALEVLLEKVHSERDAWGGRVALVGARIGWVRGTGLMDANNPLSARLETDTGIRTFSAAEMGLLLAALFAPAVAAEAAAAPVRADLSAGFDRVVDLRGVVGRIRAELASAAARARRSSALLEREAALLAAPDLRPTPVIPLVEGPAPEPEPGPVAWPDIQVPLDQVVVLVGAAELGPWGSHRTRFEIEVQDRLSDAGVLELAWLTGLVKADPDGGWVDGATGDPVALDRLGELYRDRVMASAGIRWIEPAMAGFDPARLPVMATAWLDRDMSFRVGSAEEAESFRLADPEHTELNTDESGGWVVTRKAGSEIRVPRIFRMDRHVAGLLPAGFDPTRYGVPAELVGQVDRVGLMNLAVTADAFLSAGVTPEQLLSWVHPARIANTQGSGLGGGQSLKRLYSDLLLGQRRQLDALQETLINVVAAHVVQGFVGSYGAMSHPVAACATAAVSLEEGLDKILLGKADIVVAGGFDDISAEGSLGFMDMGATANTDEMTASGLSPRSMSRPNDQRRHGFVEAHGGGTMILARGTIARDLGLPVLGVLAYAGSFGDGLHRSIPAPGLGALAAGLGGREGPLGQALSRWGLCADDIAVVYKHDTSTNANDLNENRLHHSLQSALGRTPGNPLFVVSQKSVTGHAKGGSAAWQTIGLLQALAAGVIPGNRNLDSVDEAMRPFGHMAFTDQLLKPGAALPLRAGLLTSLGFGHVSALVLLLHPEAFAAALPVEARTAWRAAATARREQGRLAWIRAMHGEGQVFSRPSGRRLPHADGSDAQLLAEAAVLIDPTARLDPNTGMYRGRA